MPDTFGIVDLFVGPGGLGEGFASLRVGDHSPFQIGISVEKETSAHRTLTLRAFFRAYAQKHGVLPKPYIDFHSGQSAEPDWSTVDAAAWDHTTSEARCLKLGTEPAADPTLADAILDRVRAFLRTSGSHALTSQRPQAQTHRRKHAKSRRPQLKP